MAIAQVMDLLFHTGYMKTYLKLECSIKALEFNLDIKLFVGKNKKRLAKFNFEFTWDKERQIYESDQAFFTKVSKLYICRLPYIHSREVKFDPEGDCG